VVFGWEKKKPPTFVSDKIYNLLLYPKGRYVKENYVDGQIEPIAAQVAKTTMTMITA